MSLVSNDPHKRPLVVWELALFVALLLWANPVSAANPRTASAPEQNPVRVGSPPPPGALENERPEKSPDAAASAGELPHAEPASTARTFRVTLEAEADVSPLEPNTQIERTVGFSAGLPPTSTLKVWRGDPNRGPDDPHACLRVFYARQELGYSEDNAVTVASPHHADAEAPSEAVLTLRVDHDCGWLEDARVRAVPIVFRHTAVKDARQVQWQYVLRNPVALEEEVTLETRVGRGPTVRAWGPSWALDHPRTFLASIELDSSATPLPEGVSLGFRATNPLRDEDPDALASSHTFTVKRGDAVPPLLLVAKATACSAPGVYTVPLRTVLLNDDGTPGRARTTMLTVEVTGTRFLCWWPRFALGAALLALISLLSSGYHRRVKG